MIKYNIPVRFDLLFDKASDAEAEVERLERYFNDLYPFFMKKLADYSIGNKSNPTDEEDLKKILAELITVKRSMYK